MDFNAAIFDLDGTILDVEETDVGILHFQTCHP